MSKYLFFIILGIILFLYINSIEGLNVGVPEYNIVNDEIIGNTSTRPWTEELDSGINNDVFEGERNLEGNVDYYVWADNENDARRKLKRYQMLNRVDENIINIQLSTNKYPYVAKPNVGCILQPIDHGSVTNYSDICYDSCEYVNRTRGIDVNLCKTYHTNMTLAQNCSFVNNLNNTEKRLEKDGFQKIPDVINVETDITQVTDPNFTHFYNTRFDNSQRNNLDLTFPEYLFKKFLEKVNLNSNLQKINEGIYFLNGKIILCQFINENLRTINIRTENKWSNLTEDQQEAANILGWNEDTWDNLNDAPFNTKWSDLTEDQQEAATSLGWNEQTWDNNPYRFLDSILRRRGETTAFSILHSDYQKFIKFEPKEENRFETEDLQTICIRNYNSKNNTQFEKGMTSKDLLFQDSSGIKIKSDDSISINLWLLLYGDNDIQTLGFIDIIDDEEQRKYNAEILKEMAGSDKVFTSNTDFELYTDRLTNYFPNGPTGIRGNVLEINTFDNTGDPDKPDINPNILYTYNNMRKGDVFAFHSDIPHIGFPSNNRTSVEFSYDYLEFDILTNFSDYFTIVSEGDEDDIEFFLDNYCSATLLNSVEDIIKQDYFVQIPKSLNFKPDLQVLFCSKMNCEDMDISSIIVKIKNYFDKIFQKLRERYFLVMNQSVLEDATQYRDLGNEPEDINILKDFLVSLNRVETIPYLQKDQIFDGLIAQYEF